MPKFVMLAYIDEGDADMFVHRLTEDTPVYAKAEKYLDKLDGMDAHYVLDCEIEDDMELFNSIQDEPQVYLPSHVDAIFSCWFY